MAPQKPQRFLRSLGHASTPCLGPADPAQAAAPWAVDETIRSALREKLPRTGTASASFNLYGTWRKQRRQPFVPLSSCNQRDEMKLLGKRLQWLAEIVIDLPQAAVRPHHPRGTNRPEKRNATISCGFTVDMHPARVCIGDESPDPLSDMSREFHLVRPVSMERPARVHEDVGYVSS